MKNTAVTALLLAGSVLFCGGFARGTVKSGVVVGGVEVGGMPYAEAERAVREHIAEEIAPFTVRTPTGVFTFPLTFSDDVSTLVRRAKRGENLAVSYRRTWADAEGDILAVCIANAREAQDASVRFSSGGFVYTGERAGRYCDYKKLLRTALAALDAGEEGICFVPASYAPKIREEDLRARTQVLATFSTRFDAGNAPRAHNIELAARRISGVTVEAGSEFSFNAVVGKRTRANGFEEANIILDGEFVPGVGGGVCQASTTLFNAALRAGMEITESRPHSLSVSYVPPSLDAMVSDFSDLKFRNPYPFPVYIAAAAGSGTVRFTVYGAPDGRRYETESRVLARLAPPAEEVVEGDEDKILRAEREGVSSESFLVVYEGERVVLRTRIRKDTYACVRGKRQVRQNAPAEEPSQENGEDKKKIP